MKLTLRELPASPIEEATTSSRVTHAPSGCVSDFLQARDRLPAGLEGTGHDFEMNRIAKEAAAHRLHAVMRMDRLEESVYWLLSAATIVYLLLGIISR
jgi:hypothetical protein